MRHFEYLVCSMYKCSFNLNGKEAADNCVLLTKNTVLYMIDYLTSSFCKCTLYSGCIFPQNYWNWSFLQMHSFKVQKWTFGILSTFVIVNCTKIKNYLQCSWLLFVNLLLNCLLPVLYMPKTVMITAFDVLMLDARSGLGSACPTVMAPRRLVV